jgi:hypothetical protein
MTYLKLLAAEHSSALDRQFVESVFDSYSVKGDQAKDKDLNDNEPYKMLTKGNGILAYEEVFGTWKV